MDLQTHRQKIKLTHQHFLLMKNINWKKEVVIWVAILAPFIYSIYIWNQLPDQVPTHWNIKGEVDDNSGKAFALFLLPAMNVFIYFVLLFIPRIDPRYQHYKLFGSSYQNIRMIIHIFFVGVFAFVIHASLTNNAGGINFLMAGMGLFFALLGNYMRTVRSNWFVGIRTPWTLSNEEVWRKTHLLGGRIWFYGGLVIAVTCLFLPEAAAGIFLFCGVGVMALVPVIYSYIEYRRINQSSSENKNAG